MAAGAYQQQNTSAFDQMVGYRGNCQNDDVRDAVSAAADLRCER
jgi:hypothetical protein